MEKIVPSHIHIRPAVEADFPRLVELFRDFSVFEHQPEKMINSIPRMMDEKNYFNAFVAETSDHLIVGYATWFYCYFTWTGKSLYMDDLYVVPEYRGKGIGTLLIGQVKDLAKSTGCYKMRWQVSCWNAPAIGFYKKLGAEINQVDQNCDLILS